MSIRTPLCDHLGIAHPIVQAPIGSATTPELAAAVSSAGGLGTLAITWRDEAETRLVVERTRTLTDAPFGVNVVVDEATTDVPPADLIDVALDAGADVVSISFGEAAPHVDRVHEADAPVLQTVGSAEAATTAVRAGVDVVVAQGRPAGGHVQGEASTLALVPRVADAVDVPVVAAGGIADGRGVTAAIALGADGAWLGTRFLVAEEADVHAEYRRRVLDADETDTALTSLFDKGWPGTPHRVLRNATVERWEAAGRPRPGDRPGENDEVAQGSDGPIERYDEALATRAVEGDVGEMALFAGQGVGLAREVEPASRIVESLVAGTESTIGRLGGSLE